VLADERIANRLEQYGPVLGAKRFEIKAISLTNACIGHCHLRFVEPSMWI
jgi:hypothetical protein